MSVDVVTSLVLHPSLTADQHHNELLSMEQPSPSHHHRTRKRGVLATNLLQLPVQHITTTTTSPSSPQDKGDEDQDEDDLDEEDSFYESRKPSLMSSLEDLTPEAVPSVQNRCIATLEQLAVARGWQEGENGSFPGDSPTHHSKIAVNRFTRRYREEDPDRKSSDPLVKERGDVLRRSREDRQRCLSDSEKETKRNSPVVCEESLDYSSTHGGDSGFDDCRPKPLQIVTTTVPSDCEEATAPVLSSRRRRPAISPLQVMPAAFNLNHPQHSPLSITPEEQSSPVLPGSRKHSRRRQTLTKHLSLCSIGGSSDSYSVQSSLFECSSTTTDVTDVLSILGFGDFDDPQLIPDRFIPAEASHARPSSMRQQSLLNLFNSSSSPTPSAAESDHAPSAAASMYSNDRHSPLSPTPRPESPSHFSSATEVPDPDFHLPLGATADNFLPKRARPSSPPPPSSQSHPPSEPAYSPATDPTISHYHPGYAPLEPVPEETASDLSPSPRWLSPRVSIDHSWDVAMGHLLGASLNVTTAARKRSLPNREGYRVSVESMVSEQDSIYFSVTSYDDDIAREKREREELAAQLVGEEMSGVRRRRKGVYEPPPQLLSWLDQQKVEDDSPEEQPWPFNETAHLRKSLSELMEAQAKLSTHGKLSNPWERPLSPTFSKPSFDYAPTRRSSFGEMLRRRSCHMIPLKYHRKSLPGNCRFYPYHPSTPPPPLPEVPYEVEMIVTESPIQHGERLPPGMTRSEAQGYQRECIQLRAELGVVKERLEKSETLREKEGKNFQRKISDAEEYLRSELYRQERRCEDLEEEVTLCQREMKRLQTDTQLAVARGRESIREKKDLEIKELRHKMEEGNTELRKRVHKLEEECRQLHAKEKHLMQAASQQQNLKSEVESLYKEVAVLKQQLNSEKQTHALLSRDKALELKKLRAKAQFDKEEALKMQKDALQKTHETELAVLKKTLNQLPHQVTTYSTSPSKNRHELRCLQQEVDKNQQLLIEKESYIEELSQQLELLHKERLTLEKEMSSVLGKK